MPKNIQEAREKAARGKVKTGKKGQKEDGRKQEVVVKKMHRRKKTGNGTKNRN